MLEGVTAPEEAAVFHIVYDDGSIGRIEVTGGSDLPPLSRPGRLVDEAEYQTHIAVLEQQRAAHLAELDAAQQARSRTDFLALTLLGLSAETARRITGYAGTDVNPSDEHES
jgi:hypothetical protein